MNTDQAVARFADMTAAGAADAVQAGGEYLRAWAIFNLSAGFVLLIIAGAVAWGIVAKIQSARGVKRTRDDITWDNTVIGGGSVLVVLFGFGALVFLLDFDNWLSAFSARMALAKAAFALLHRH